MWRGVRCTLFGLDVALLAMVLGLWWHSQTVADMASLGVPPDGRTQFAASLRGRVVLAVSGFVLDDRRPWRLEWTSENAESGRKLFEEIIKGPTVTSAAGLMEYHRGRAMVGGSASGRWWMLVVPHWMLAALLAPWPLSRVLTTLRRTRRLRRGECPACGHALETGPATCPKCGWSSAMAGQKRRRRVPWVAIVTALLACGVYLLLRPEEPITTRGTPPVPYVDVDIAPGSLKDALEKFCRQASLELVIDQNPGHGRFPALRLRRVDVEIAAKLAGQLAHVPVWLDGPRLHIGEPARPRGADRFRVYDISHATEQMRAFDRALRAAGIVPLGGAEPRDSAARGDASIVEVLCLLSATSPTASNDPIRVVGNKVIVPASNKGHQNMPAAVGIIEALAAAHQAPVMQFDSRGEKFARVALGRLAPAPKPNPQLRLPMPHLNDETLSLRDALKELADRTALNLVVDWKEIEAAGIDPDTSIIVDFEDDPWAEALNVVLTRATGTGARLGWLAEQNLVFVSTADALDTWWVARVYDIRDIVLARSKWGETSEENAVRIISLRVKRMVEDPNVLEAFEWEHAYCGGRLYVWTAAERHALIEEELAKMRAELK